MTVYTCTDLKTKPESVNPLLAAALAYARSGLRVLPLKPRGTEPLFEGAVAQATTCETTIRFWWAACPDANIGLATRGYERGAEAGDG